MSEGELERARFLVVEDDEILARVLVRAIKTRAEVDVVSTCVAAREALRSRRYVGLIVDIGLPDGSGYDVLRAERQRGLKIEALVVTGSDDRETVNRVSTLNARLLLKPFAIEHVDAYVTSALERVTVVEAALARWQARYDFSVAELTNLQLTAEGYAQTQIALIRGVSKSSVRTQSKNMLEKTGDLTLAFAAIRMLRGD